MGGVGEDTAQQVSSVKGKAIISVGKRELLKRCIDEQWFQDRIPDAEVISVRYDFERDAFGFIVSSEALAPLPDGNYLPVIHAKPALGQPPKFIIGELKARIEELEEQVHEHHLGEGESDTVVALRKELAAVNASIQLGFGGIIGKLRNDNPGLDIDYDFDTGKHIIKLKSGAAGQYKADSQPSADIKYAEGKAHTAHFVIPYFIYETLGPNKSRALEEAILAFYRVKLQELKS